MYFCTNLHHFAKMKHSFRFILFSICALISAYAPQALAQRHEAFSEQIRSLQVVGGDRWMELPVIQLGGDEVVTISFDDMTHEYHRYTYSVEHCEADWSVSEGLFESEYFEGTYGSQIIENNEQSLNMATLYTHYSLSIPNSNCRLKLSGNYRITITDDNSGEQVARAYFMIVEPRIGVSTETVTNTDIDFNNAHQQLNITLNYNGVQVTDPERQLKTIVMQNNRWTTARTLPRPQYISREGLKWQHCRDLIFPATNEYRKFEYLDIHRNSMGVDHTGFDGSDYHVWINTDYPRPNYVYDEDANGAYYIRNTDNYNNDTESEYFIAHFTYHTSEPFHGEVYLNGAWTNDRLLPEYKMEYDPLEKVYTCAVKLKMGYYSYQYLLQHSDGSLEYLPSEGNYYETENSYSCLVYFRPHGGRTDLLFGYK